MLRLFFLAESVLDAMADDTRMNEGERQELVAYLDGELPEVECLQVEQKLADSPAARREVEALQRTWDLLDHLPKATASHDFATKTLSRIQAIQTPPSENANRVPPWVRQAGFALGWVGGAAAAAVVGFAVARFGWPTPTDRLARDLPVVERLYEYRAVSDVDFLRELEQAGLFADEES